jgi:hypothetical protein
LYTPGDRPSILQQVLEEARSELLALSSREIGAVLIHFPENPSEALVVGSRLGKYVFHQFVGAPHRFACASHSAAQETFGPVICI